MRHLTLCLLLLLLLLPLPAISGDWWPVQVNTNTGAVHIGPWSPPTGFTNWWLTPTNITSGGDVYTTSNNVLAGTQSMDGLLVTGKLSLINEPYYTDHLAQLWRGIDIWCDSNGDGWIVGPYSGLGAARTFIGRWTGPDTVKTLAWLDTRGFCIGEHLIVTNGDIEVSTSSFIGPANAGDRPGKGLSFDSAGNATLTPATLNGYTIANWATNAGPAGGGMYGMTNGAWAVIPASTGDSATNAGAAGADAYVMSNKAWVARGSATGDLSKASADGLYLAGTAGADAYVMSNKAWVARGSATGNLSKASADVLYLGIGAKAADSEKLDNLDSTAFQLASVTNAVPVGYISGCFITYVDTNTVTVGIGDGFCSNQYFRNTAAVSVDISGITTTPTWDWHYIYLDYSASTFPASPSFYTATNEPAKVGAMNGWYHPTTSGDRVLGAVITSNNVAILLPFSTNKGGRHMFGWTDPVTMWACFMIGTAQNAPASSAWQVPDDMESSARLPVNAFETFAVAQGTYTAPVWISVTSYEASLLPHPYVYAAADGIMTYATVAVVGGWVPLGASRNLRYSIAACNAGTLYLGIGGYSCER